MKLVGDHSVTVVTLPMPIEQVRAMLPQGLMLGPQRLVHKRGWYPLRFYFNRVQLGMTGLPPFPYIDYNEQVLTIPNVYRTGGTCQRTPVGPYSYMPRVFLDSPFAIAGGIVVWGMEKRYGRFSYSSDILGSRWPGHEVDADPELEQKPALGPDWASVRVLELYSTRPTLKLDWRVDGPFSRVTRRIEPSTPSGQLLTHFRPHRHAMNQPLVLQAPMGFGPALVAGLFQMIWPRARVRSLETKVTLYHEYVPGIEVGTYHSPGLAEDPLGSYQLQCPWVQWLPYSCAIADRIDESRCDEGPGAEQAFRLMTGPYRPRLGDPVNIEPPSRGSRGSREVSHSL